MDLLKIVSVLDSDTRLKILSILADEHLTLDEIFVKIRKINSQVKYRESVYRATEKLVKAGLVEKFYDQGKGISYKLIVKNVKIDLIKSEVILGE